MTTTQSAPRQTLSYLRRLLEERGIEPKNKLGQNFLIDLNLVELIARSAELTREDLALEVGSGTGSLTVRLASEAAAVVSIELDPSFFNLAEETVTGLANVTLIHGDVLAGKNVINPEVFAQVEAVAQSFGCTRRKLVANLPYAIATPLIANLLLSDLPLERMVVTVQWEIAERLMALPATKPFGALAVLVQSLADVELVRKLSPAVFWPRPQVSSAIVLIRPNGSKRALVGDVRKWRDFLRDLYVHRRKNLRGALVASPRGRREKSDVDAKLATLGLAGTGRAEELSVQQHLRLAEVFG